MVPPSRESKPFRSVSGLMVAIVMVAVLGACDQDSAGVGAPDPVPTRSSAAPTAPASTVPTAPDEVSPEASQALCDLAAVTVAQETRWRLRPGQPRQRDVRGSLVPACDFAGRAGEPSTRLSVTYAPATGDARALLEAVCSQVVGRDLVGSDRSCAQPPRSPRVPGVVLRRADLASGEAGVVTLSFRTQVASWRTTSAGDLGFVGLALARDPALAASTG